MKRRTKKQIESQAQFEKWWARRPKFDSRMRSKTDKQLNKIISEGRTAEIERRWRKTEYIAKMEANKVWNVLKGSTEKVKNAEKTPLTNHRHPC